MESQDLNQNWQAHQSVDSLKRRYPKKLVVT
uniref:Uncharacterized protein n=1 Tax=Arundo donax TaxID=35708 RepID=A0A0A9A6G3_ARUDO